MVSEWSLKGVEKTHTQKRASILSSMRVPFSSRSGSHFSVTFIHSKKIMIEWCYQNSRGSNPLHVMTHPPDSTGDSTLRMIPPSVCVKGWGVKRTSKRRQK